eukprot:CAMPEP_0175043520 /NCGR_PEP_ID=MMETSP0052_2-20121109/3238_1 /TAXON_ID=51329 ORGANISM="Polytomella parva, Strain SAG 63-3" /NCGR_SAMPLE_ID=MMETSP0052_2 /ASSEMBLY_ACC=CAM_ASM_000194 /LENGTH=324 /DNA_ID=CAMNT_0016306599 /DNA_START=87 /DNA_END=1057 /DNA_ORIENTATION=-
MTEEELLGSGMARWRSDERRERVDKMQKDWVLEDPFLPWPDVKALIQARRAAILLEKEAESQQDAEDDLENYFSEEDEAMESEEDDEEEEQGLSPYERWIPGEFLDITTGYADMQLFFDSAASPPAIPSTFLPSSPSPSSPSFVALSQPFPSLAVLLWHADWAAASFQLRDQIRSEFLDSKLAKSTAFLSLNVTASFDNHRAALAKVMYRPTTRKDDSKPYLKSGEKWPCVSVFEPPLMAPVSHFEGSEAFAKLRAFLSERGALREKEGKEKEGKEKEGEQEGEKEKAFVAFMQHQRQQRERDRVERQEAKAKRREERRLSRER